MPTPASPRSVIGQRLRRPDAPDKVKGTALYIEDLDFAGSLFGGVLRSPHAHARIRKLDATRARAVPGVRAVVTAREIPGRNVIPMIQSDWPVLAQDFVRHVGEALALVAADTREALAEALAAVQVEYEPLPALAGHGGGAGGGRGDGALQGPPRRGRRRAHAQRPGGGRGRLPHAVPGARVHRAQRHGRAPDGTGGVVVHGSMQCPFYVQKAVASALGCDLNRVRVVQTVTGGGFGGKEDAPSAARRPRGPAGAGHRPPGAPALLARRGHGGHVQAPSGPHPGEGGRDPRDGHLIAAEVDYLLDGGAYATLSPVVLFRGTVHACGPYRVPNVRVDARVVRTHKVPCGAFRGFGEPQVVFALEADRRAGRAARPWTRWSCA